MSRRRRADFVLDPKRVGLAIRARRTDRGQARSALPIADETLRSIEIGDTLPSLDTAARLADHFGCTIDDLVGRRATTAAVGCFAGRDGLPPVSVPPGLVRDTGAASDAAPGRATTAR